MKRKNHSWPKRAPLIGIEGIGRVRAFQCFKCGAQRLVYKTSFMDIPHIYFRFRPGTPYQQVKRLPECNPVALKFWCEAI